MLIPLVVIALLSALSYATTVSISTTTLQAQYGLGYDVTAAFTATDKGFTTTAATKAASAQPATWSNGGTVNTALVKNRYLYSLLLTLNTVPASTTIYTITVKWDQGSGQVQLGQLTVSVPNTAVAAQSMTFQFDTGGTSFTTPLAVDVTVA